jgi:small subunit ribosomal protein S6
MELNNYETVIILTPVLSSQQVKEATDAYGELITAAGGQMVHQENWGLTKLAYPIQKKITGFYHIFEYTAPGNIIQELELQLRRDERLMRYLTTRLDKHSLKYNEKRRSGAFNKPKVKPATAE